MAAQKKAKATKPAKAKRTAAPKVKPGQAGFDDAVIAAALSLAAEGDWNDVTLKVIAKKAKVPLADLLECFADKNAIVAAYMRQVDRAVLERLDSDIEQEAVRDRLLDIFISRLEVLGENKAAVQSIWRALSRDPQAMLALAPSVLRSQKTMMAAADLDASGIAGTMRAQGLALIFARGLRTFLHDNDPGMARAMAKLDRGLRDGEAMLSRLSRLDDLGKVATAFVSAVMKRRAEKRADKGEGG